MNPLQSLLTDPTVVSVEALEKQIRLPEPAAKVSDTEIDSKPVKPKKSPQVKKETTVKTPKSAKPKPVINEKVNGSSISYASVAASSQPSEQPQLMSPMVFTGQSQPSPGPTLPIIPPVLPMNNGMATQPMGSASIPQITPLTEAQLLQAFQHLLRTDRSFVGRLHQAYVESLNTQLN